MSFPAMAWAVRQKLPCTQKIVLLMLADRHNSDTGRCDPSHDRLASDCGLTRRSVMDQLSKLDGAGFIKTHHRVIDKLKTSNQYMLMLDFGVVADVNVFHIDVNQVPVVVNVVHQGSEPRSHKPVKEPVREPKEKKAQAPSFLVLPDWINKSHWETWHACDKRRKTTDAQKRMTVEKLTKWRAEGVDAEAALENAAIGGWSGIHKPDDKKTTASETVYQRSMRERMQEIAPSIARAAPGTVKQNLVDFFANAPALGVSL